NPYKEHYNQMEDFELWYRIIDKYVFKNVNIPVLFYREDSTPNSIKHKKIIRNYKFVANEFNFSFMLKHYIISSVWIKYLTYSVLEAADMGKILLKRRFSRLSHSDTEKYNEILKLVTNR
ncbi:MAG: hypothetical protein ACQUHE_19255, partial [Bacteroidia bacterium]